jgi:AcrR family transcriptional regulator
VPFLTGYASSHTWSSRPALTTAIPVGPLLRWVMAEMHDREKLIDVALDLCIRQGYEATTIDQIAAAVGVTSHAVGRYFATKDAIILSIVDDIVVAVATELAQIPPQTSPPEALLAANTEALLAANTAVISDIANGGGVITRERMQALAHILTASLDLRKKASALGKQVLSAALAERMGVGPEDSRVRLAVTVRAAVIAAAYNFDRGGRVRLDPRNDGRVPELMVKRLNDTFTHITGRAPADPNRPSR